MTPDELTILTTKPAAAPKPIKRLLKAAQAFAQDGPVPNANKVAHEAMFDVLDGILAENQNAVGVGVGADPHRPDPAAPRPAWRG